MLRLAGMYGPGRLPKWSDVLGGGPVSAPDEAYLNLIHVDDAVRVILAADLRGSDAPGSLPGVGRFADRSPGILPARWHGNWGWRSRPSASPEPGQPGARRRRGATSA